MSDESSGSDSWRENGQTDWISPGVVEASAHLDEVFEALAHSRRRYLLYCLTKASGSVTERSELVAALQVFEEEATEGDASPTRESIELDLHHTHLPKLADAGFVEYDTRQGTVRYDEPPALQEWLAHAFYKEVGRPL